MIDFHTHILPNIDNGSRNIEETFNLIKEAKEAGFEGIVLTSHYKEGYYETDTPEREVWVNAITENLRAKGIDIKVYLANEIYITDNMMELLEAGKASTINNTCYVLIDLPLDEEERNQYAYVKNILEQKGYKHYEISNFSLPGKQAIHNTNCWEQKEYLGFGAAAHSYFDMKRFSNTDSLHKYLSESFEKIRIIDEVQNIEEQEKEFMMLGLRKIDGVGIDAFKNKFGKNPIFLFRKEIQKLVEQGLLEVDLNQIRLTRKGLDLANIVWEEFV